MFSSRDFFLTDPAFSGSKRSQNIANQKQQVKETNLARDPTNGRWNVRNQTGFDDERDNAIDDRARRQDSYAQYQAKTEKNDMAYDDDDSPRSKRNSPQTVINSSRPSDYAPGEKLREGMAKIRSDSYTSFRNNRYNTDKKDETDRKIRAAEVGVKRELGYVNAEVDRQSRQFKTLADLQAALDNNEKTYRVGINKNEAYKQIGLDQNQKVYEASKFETSTKYQTQKDINKYQWDNVNQTSLAEAQVKAGTYGMSKESQAKAANDKINFDNWKRQNDANFDYADRMNAAIKLTQDMGRANQAYSDQRLDRQNDRAAAMHRFQVEQNNRNADRAQQSALQKEAREQQRADFNLRSQQIQSQIDLANRDFSLRSQESAARVADIYGTLGLKTQQFAATRADVGYNRSQQGRSRSNLAF